MNDSSPSPPSHWYEAANGYISFRDMTVTVPVIRLSRYCNSTIHVIRNYLTVTTWTNNIYTVKMTILDYPN